MLKLFCARRRDTFISKSKYHRTFYSVVSFELRFAAYGCGGWPPQVVGGSRFVSSPDSATAVNDKGRV